MLENCPFLLCGVQQLQGLSVHQRQADSTITVLKQSERDTVKKRQQLATS